MNAQAYGKVSASHPVGIFTSLEGVQVGRVHQSCRGVVATNPGFGLTLWRTAAIACV